ncbi:unnamed protein product [Rodentolepis nana]|uniref:V-SNARE coiled-coil homology domain-containing protein n=1 Tax=Rodentolepis nana TaxID=102285 RepID=A0A3P7W4R7_RODNA|nr:unnamed protein product [Rodentolepis nana]
MIFLFYACLICREPTPDQNASGEPFRPAPTNKRFQQTQAQVNEVVDIMRVNMEKVLERDAKLAQLDDRADALQAGASQFEARYIFGGKSESAPPPSPTLPSGPTVGGKEGGATVLPTEPTSAHLPGGPGTRGVVNPKLVNSHRPAAVAA